MSAAPVPALSVVLVAPSGLAPLRRTLSAIASQTIAETIELIVVGTSDDLLQPATRLLQPLHSHRVLVEQRISNVDHAAARGLLDASAPIVASIEDHAFPEPDWAEQLLDVWTEDTVAVGSAIRNANPSSSLSWSNILLAYGAWSEQTPEGDTEWIAMHNGTFRRSALEPYHDELPSLFNREGEILLRLKKNGGLFRFAPRAKIRHLNPSSLGSSARLRFDAGRLYAANRARDEGWRFWKRAAYSLLSPAIPPLRYIRMRKQLFGAGKDLNESKLGPALFTGLLFDAAGQATGFLAGPGSARERLSTFEMDRLQHLNERDRTIFAPDDTQRSPTLASPDHAEAASRA